jgi:hypothetical protein
VTCSPSSGDPIDDEIVVRIVDEIVLPLVAARP